MAKRGRKKARKSPAKRKGGAGAQRKRFAAAARKCWTKLRAGELPKRGMFSKCMKSEL